MHKISMAKVIRHARLGGRALSQDVFSSLWTPTRWVWWCKPAPATTAVHKEGAWCLHYTAVKQFKVVRSSQSVSCRRVCCRFRSLRSRLNPQAVVAVRIPHSSHDAAAAAAEPNVTRNIRWCPPRLRTSLRCPSFNSTVQTRGCGRHVSCFRLILVHSLERLVSFNSCPARGWLHGNL